MKGTEVASSRSAEEEAGRYETVVRNSSVKSIMIDLTNGSLKSAQRLTVMPP